MISSLCAAPYLFLYIFMFFLSCTRARALCIAHYYYTTLPLWFFFQWRMPLFMLVFAPVRLLCLLFWQLHCVLHYLLFYNLSLTYSYIIIFHNFLFSFQFLSTLPSDIWSKKHTTSLLDYVAQSKSSQNVPEY